jgi:glutamate--cysteine ligase
VAEYITRGIEHGCGDCIGLELEHFIVRADDFAAVPYLDDSQSGKPGVGSILERLAPFYDEKIYETQNSGNKSLIGLSRNYVNITLEPGAQFEISIGPVLRLQSLESIYRGFRAEIDPILAEYGYRLLELGYHPTSEARAVSLIPKDRYHFMDEYFRSTGKHGICMMRATASTQVSIDYSSEADAVKKFRIANALGPLFAFITDNSPIFERVPVGTLASAAPTNSTTIAPSGLPVPHRMARTAIWDDVDPLRSMIAPHSFDSRFSFASYAASILQAPAIFTTQHGSDGEKRSIPQGMRPFTEVLPATSPSRADIEHLLSLFFFDVRFKTYIEIRMADSLPIEYALAFTALIKGLFYGDKNVPLLEQQLSRFNEDDVARAKEALREQGFDATVYERPASEWLDELISMARGALDNAERPYLEPLAELIATRTTLLDRAPLKACANGCTSTPTPTPPPAPPEPTTTPKTPTSPAAPTPSLPSALPALQAKYRAHFLALDGDKDGRLAAQNYLNNSTAIYHDAVIGLGFLPKIYDTQTLLSFDTLTTRTYGILEKVTQRFLADPSYRALFGFSPTLERLICLPTGYECLIPIMRMDIFLNEESLDFAFCEFNTDGTSAMNEDREGANALCKSTVYAHASRELKLAPQELFEGWVSQFLAIYASSEQAQARPTDTPLIAIVDYTESSTPYEFEEFRTRFEQRGLRCLICDVRSLEYREDALYGTDHNPARFGTDELQRIDAVYRRAVTGEIVAELEECAATEAQTNEAPFPRGARALIRAVESQDVCMIGGFVTHVAHCKQLYTVLHLPATEAFLSDEEVAFIRKHVPYTTRLDNQHIDLNTVKANKDCWIIKPEDGYASKGVHAGKDYSAKEWDEIVERCSSERYIVQIFCEQYATPNIRLSPIAEADTRLEPWNILTGLYLYGGRFSGLFVRAGQKGIIAGFAGGVTVPCFLADYDSKAALALLPR